jgi:hypothetical protein
MRASLQSGARGSSEPRSFLQRLLLALGTDPDVAEAVVGDLTEEYAVRRAQRGDAVAWLWLLHEALRSLPPFLWSAIRHGTPAVRARLAAAVAGCALAITIVVVALLSRDGPPSRLVANAGNGVDGIVVNNLRPVRLEMHALDKRGRRVSSHGVQFRWASGVPATISPAGVLTCTHDGDVTVRASLGAVVTDVGVMCRRVREMYASSWIDLVAGDSARPLPYVALGVDGSPVTELRGQATIVDSSVATLAGAGIRPRAVGRTHVRLDIGDRGTQILVTVHEPVRTFDALRDDQRYVAVPVHLARGDTLRWALPREAFWLAYLPRHQGDAPPTIILDGVISCAPGDALHQYLTPMDEPRMYCVVYSAGAGVTLAHGSAGAPEVDGSLIFQRVDEWRRPQ